MVQNQKRKLTQLLSSHEKELLDTWVEEQLASMSQGMNLITETEMRRQSQAFLQLFRQVVEVSDQSDISAPQWGNVRQLLSEISRSRAQQGFSPAETALFIFSLKQALFEHLRRELGHDSEALVGEIGEAGALLDRLGLYTIEVYQKNREEIIQRQQQELLELSTPVIRLWEGIVAVPLIGTLDSARTQVVMESLLEKIVETGSSVAIIDITGVPIVDTLVAQYLLKTVAAARLMGAECIISGIRPQIAQTIVHLGISLADVVTKADLSGAFALALQRTGYLVTRSQNRS